MVIGDGHLNISGELLQWLQFHNYCFSALVKLLNKSIEGTADDDEEGVTPDTAIRSGLELLKVNSHTQLHCFKFELCAVCNRSHSNVLLSALFTCVLHLPGPVIHPPHSVPLGRDLRVSAAVFEDGGWKGGWGSNSDIPQHRAEDWDRVTTDTIVR